MVDESASPTELALSGIFEGFEPSEMFAMWVVPDFLERWWPEQATVTSGQGGEYLFEWPERGWILQGHYTAWYPGSRLGFTWNWNQEGGAERFVDVRFEPSGDGGTQVTIRQGPYSGDSGDQTARYAHREGWLHFCMRLAGLRHGDLVPTDKEERAPSEEGARPES